MVGFIMGGTGGEGIVPPALTTPAVAGEVLSGKEFINGSNEKVTGTISSKGVATYTPGASAQTIAAGQYLSGKQTIAAIPSTYKRVYTADVDFSSSGNVQTHTISGLGFTPTQFYMMERDDAFPTATTNKRLISLSHNGGGSYPIKADALTGSTYTLYAHGNKGVTFSSGQVSIDLSDISSILYFDNCVYRVVCLG